MTKDSMDTKCLMVSYDLQSDTFNLAQSMGLFFLKTDYITEQGKIDSRKKKDVLSARYTDAKPRSRNMKDSEFTTDLEAYEMEQTSNAQLTSGALDREVIVDEYEYVFDESVKIQFALDADDRIAGTLGGKDAVLQAQIDEAERRGMF